MLPDVAPPPVSLPVALIGPEVFQDSDGFFSLANTHHLIYKVAGWEFRGIHTDQAGRDVFDQASRVGFRFFDIINTVPLSLEAVKRAIFSCQVACATNELRTLSLQFPVRDPDSVELFLLALEFFSSGNSFNLPRYNELITHGS